MGDQLKPITPETTTPPIGGNMGAISEQSGAPLDVDAGVKGVSAVPGVVSAATVAVG